MPSPRDEVFWSVGDRPVATPLAASISVDVAVVGGGVAGLTCAQTLNERGLRVALLERGFCGSGASGKSSGFVTPDSEMQLSDLVSKFGSDRGGTLWRLVESGVDLIRGNIHELGIDCDFDVQDSLLVGVDGRGAQHVDDEHQARQRMGYASSLYRRAEVPGVLGSQRYSGAVRYPGTFGMNSYLYCRGLRDVLARRGVAIHEQTEVTRISPEGATAGAHEVRAGHVVVCTDRFLPDLGLLVDRVGQLQTFLAISEPLPDASIARLFPDGRLMVWDTSVIYHYFRIAGGSRLLVGGADLTQTYATHERHDPQKSVEPLASYTAATFPHLSVQWAHVWPGMLGVTKDFVPLAGRDRRWPNVHYVAAATGLPWASALGRSAACSIGGEGDELFPELDPYRRFRLGKTWTGLLSKPVVFALSHGVLKIRQRYF